MKATEIVSQDESKGTQAQAPKQVIPETLTTQQALQVLVDAVRIAQSKGVYTLEDAALVLKAIDTFTPKGPVPSNQ